MDYLLCRKACRADINQTDVVDGMTPLMIAVRYGSKHSVEILLQHKPDVSCTNALSRYARDLCEDRVSDDRMSDSAEIKDMITNYGNSQFDVINKLFDAVCDKNVSTLRSIRKKGWSLDLTEENKRWYEGQLLDGPCMPDTPLQIAVKGGLKDVVEVLVECQADVNRIDYRGMTCFHLAVYNGDFELTSLLLGCEYIEIDHPVAANIDRGNRNTFEHADHTPLMLACAKGHLRIIAFLLKNGADSLHKDMNGKSAKDLIPPKNANFEAIYNLIKDAEEKSASDLDVGWEERTDDEGRTYYLNPTTNVTQYDKSIDPRGKSQIQADKVKLMMGYIRTANMTEITNMLDNNVFHIDTIWNLEMCQGKLCPTRNALTYAVYIRNNEIVRLLLERGADVNMVFSDGLTVLCEAVMQTNGSQLVRTLLEAGAHVNQRTKMRSGRTALFLAVSRMLKNDRDNSKDENEIDDALRCVLELVIAGADMNIRDKRGGSPSIAISRYDRGGPALLRSFQSTPIDPKYHSNGRVKPVDNYFIGSNKAATESKIPNEQFNVADQKDNVESCDSSVNQKEKITSPGLSHKQEGKNEISPRSSPKQKIKKERSPVSSTSGDLKGKKETSTAPSHKHKEKNRSSGSSPEQKRNETKVPQKTQYSKQKKGKQTESSSHSSLSQAKPQDKESSVPTLELTVQSTSEEAKLTSSENVTPLQQRAVSHEVNNDSVKANTPHPLPDDISVKSVSEGKGIPQNETIKVGVNLEVRTSGSGVLGEGHNGTTVFKGVLEDATRSGSVNHVAVKRIKLANRNLQERERELLINCPHHENVIRYLTTSEVGGFLYLALEICDMTLSTWLIDRDTKTMDAKKDVMKQTARGVRHLHSIGIVHRDLTPTNILLQNVNSTFVVKVADFDRSKQMQDTSDRVLMSDATQHTKDWMAPEILRMQDRSEYVSKAVDIFSLGCIFYYVVSDGQHPFGESRTERERNMLNKEPRLLEGLTFEDSDHFNIRGLVSNMIHYEEADRPSVQKVCRHVFFWTKQEQLDFIQEIVAYLGGNIRDRRSANESLKEHQEVVTGGDWLAKLTDIVRNDLNSRRGSEFGSVNYSKYAVKDLLRAIRNKRAHFWQGSTSDRLRKEIGALPDEIMDYFNKIFPKLLIYIYTQLDGKLSRDMSMRFYGTYRQTIYTLHI